MIYGLYTIATRLSDDARLPEKAHGEDDAAYDLYASEKCWIGAGFTALVPTGVHVEIPEGCAGLVLPRSSLAAKFGVIIPNSPGLIDPGYRGEIKVPLYKLPTQYDLRAPATETLSDYWIAAGDRIAQLLIVPTLPVEFRHADALSESARGVGGFGSTGL